MSNKQFEQDILFYQKIWNRRDHVCYECNKWLGIEPLTVFFHHVLPKKKYPQYRYATENIVLVCFTCHGQAEMNIDKTPKIKLKRDALLGMHDRGELKPREDD